jgi:PAS domain S-box-containing protein
MNPIIIDDKVVGASFFGKNISERMRAADELLESETRFKALYNASFGGIAIHDNGIILDCNQGLSELTGYSQEELTGMDGMLLVAEKSRELVLNMILTGYEKPYEAVGLRKNGEEFPVRIEARNIPYKGKIVRCTEFRDITEQKLAEEAFWESQVNFRALFEKGPIGVAYHRMIYDNSGKPVDYYFLDANRSFQKITGINPIGKLVTEAFPGIENDPFDWIGTFGEVAKNGKEIRIQQHLQLNDKWYDCVAYQYKPDHFVVAFFDITEQKKAENTLRSSEERLKILFNFAPDAYYLCDLKGNFVDGNIAAEKLLGYDKNEIIGKSFLNLNLLPSKYLLKASKLLLAGIMEKPTGPDEFVLIRKNGSKVTVEITTHPVKIEGQTLILGIARDISERKMAEKSMKEASENWNRTFQAMHSGIALLDAHQKIIQTNRAFQNFVNKDEKKLTGQNCFPFVFGKEIPAEGNLFEKMKISKTCKKTEVTINGSIFEILIDPVFNENGKITGAVLIMNDISQRKRDENIQQILYEIANAATIEKSLRELLVVVRNELSKVIDSTNFFVAMYHPETNTLRKVIFEDEKDNFVEWDAHKSLSGQVLKLKKPLLLNSNQETRFAAKNNIELLGSPAACWLGVPLMSGENAIGVMVVQSYTNENAYDSQAVRLLVLIAHELSVIIERKKMIHDLVAAKEKAEESDRLKSAFLANMSHEIRTPMNGILGFAELLKEPKLSGEEQQMFIDIIKKSGERMLNIINDLINISKIESGQMEVCFSETNINEQLEFLYNFFKLEAKQKNLKLVVNCPVQNSKAIILTDREKVYAILTNLIKNALKFTKAGSIEYGYRIAENKLIFYIKDTGIGIPRNKQKSVFERFVQANSGMTSVYEGAGLGLAIAKAYVQMLGGEIWMESEEGKGTCFYFTLPVIIKTETGSAEVNDINDEQKHGNFNATVLIAEDDETSLLYLSYILKESHFKLLAAKNGSEAIELCRSHNEIDVVLMDISMPDIDGHTAAKLIREFRPGLTIIAQTAFALDEDKEKFNDTFDDYITKPIKADELKQKIKRFLKYSDN